MRVLVALVLATSAVEAFNQPRQDSPILLDHQVRMDAAGNDFRVLRGGCKCRNAKRSLRGQEEPTTLSGSSGRRLVAANWFSCCFGGQQGQNQHHGQAAQAEERRRRTAQRQSKVYPPGPSDPNSPENSVRGSP
ncbi:hypothetical protein AC1031_014994 [Aphanomyces cochlioides]|nr:hypothetical protein AC1031_014994 [Aphanomyces cochlioides]